MDGREPRGVMYVNTHVDESTSEEEYDRWYRDVHFPDVTEPGIFVNASMFHNTASPPNPGEGRFLAFYECFWTDLEAASLAFSHHVAKLQAGTQIHLGTVSAHFGIYRSRARVFGTERRRRSQTLLAEHVDCDPAASGSAIVDWFEKERLSAALELGLYHSASLHELLFDVDSFNGLARGETPSDPAASDTPRFLALYESDLGHPRALADRLRSRATEPPAGARVRFHSTFHRARP